MSENSGSARTFATVQEYIDTVVQEIMAPIESVSLAEFRRHVSEVVGEHVRHGAQVYHSMHNTTPDLMTFQQLYAVACGDNPDVVPALLTPLGHMREGERLLWMADQRATSEDLDSVDMANLAQAHFWAFISQVYHLGSMRIDPQQAHEEQVAAEEAPDEQDFPPAQL